MSNPQHVSFMNPAFWGMSEHPTNPHKVDTEAEVMGGERMLLLSMERRMGGAVFPVLGSLVNIVCLGNLLPRANCSQQGLG